MPFEYHTLYQSSSNEELLTIVRQSEKYQPEAVKAAQDILVERDIVIDNGQMPINTLAHDDTALVKSSGKIHSTIISTFNPPSLRSPVFWTAVLIVLDLLYYLLEIERIISFYIKRYYPGMFQPEDFSLVSSFNMLWLIASYLFTPILFYLLFKRNKWGWAILLYETISVIITQTNTLYVYTTIEIPLQDIHISNLDIAWTILNYILKISLFILLLRKPVRDYFNTSRKLAIRTLTISFLIFAIEIIIIYILNMIDSNETF